MLMKTGKLEQSLQAFHNFASPPWCQPQLKITANVTFSLGMLKQANCILAISKIIKNEQAANKRRRTTVQYRTCVEVYLQLVVISPILSFQFWLRTNMPVTYNNNELKRSILFISSWTFD